MELIRLIERAFAPFADPATELHLVQDNDSVIYSFLRNGEERHGRVSTRPDGATRVTPTGGSGLPLTAFLASGQMADLDRLARVQRTLYERKLPIREWVAGPAYLDGKFHPDCLQAIDQCARIVEGKTTVVILDGPAGMGKTSLVERMAHEHALDFSNRRRTNLTLIISSRGRRLSRLNDAIAATLQDLRAGLFYQEVPVLVRHGLLNLVIDGFDELVNQEGYDDAWSSLGELIDSVAGGGVLVLSSRDTFFSEQQFVQRAHRGDELLAAHLDFRFLRLMPWSRSHVKRLFTVLSVPDVAGDEALRFFDDSSASVLGRPFFARHVATKLKKNGEVDVDALLPLIVDGFVDREAKLLFGDDAPPTTHQLLKQFFAELSAEMRTQERDWLEMDVVQFFLDAVLQEGGFPEERRRQLVHRAGAVAFLERDDEPRSSRRGFPHQVIRDAFFAQSVLSLLRNHNGHIESLLKLGVYGLDLADVVVAFAEHGQPLRRQDVQWLFNIAADRSPVDPIAMNAASLGIALCRVSALVGQEPLTLFGAYLGHTSLANCEIPPLVMRECRFGLLDLVDASGTQVDADDSVTITRARMSSMTALSKLWQCYPQAIDFLDHMGGTRIERTPADIRQIVDAQRSIDALENGTPMTSGEVLLDRLARRWARRFYFDEDDTDNEPAFLSPLWPKLKAILDKHDRLERKTTQTSGPRRELLHLRDPRSVVARAHKNPAEDTKIKALWAEVASLL